jgi:hypothetical protein
MSFGLFVLIIITARWPHDLNLFISLRSAPETRPYGISKKPHHHKANIYTSLGQRDVFLPYLAFTLTVQSTPRAVCLSQFWASGIFITVDTSLDYLWRVINAAVSRALWKFHSCSSPYFPNMSAEVTNPSINIKIEEFQLGLKTR